MKKEKAIVGSAVMENIISLAKRRGFIFQGSEIYGGLAGTWDYGPYGVALKKNIRDIWWKRFVDDRDDMYGMDAAILMNQKTWIASGHVSGFSDPLVKCESCEQTFRADQVQVVFNEEVVKSKAAPKFRKLAAEEGSAGFWKCENCGNINLSNVKKFNMMFETHVGASDDSASISYLRPETAQGMFVNFKNILDSFHPKLPFGMAQIGKAFRNEIAPRDFLFRAREFEQMEIEYFVNPADWKQAFEHFEGEVKGFIADVGLDAKKVHELEIPDGERAHYSKRTIDFEYDWPFGRKELYGLAYRTDFDLSAHAKLSKVTLEYFDEESKEKFIPHVIEPSFGLDRTVLAVLCNAYTEDVMGEEKRVYLKLAPSVAPVKIAVFPLLKNKSELVKKAKEIYVLLKKEFGAVEFDDNGNIGKRYRREDEIGTPFCVTIDFDTLEKSSGVTVRDRDSGKQERVGEGELIKFFSGKI